MGGSHFRTRVALAVLATWRVTHLLAKEDGPGDLIARLRARLGEGPAGKLLDCFYCLSFWVAAPISLLARPRPGDRALTWLAVCGAACLVERATSREVVIQPLAETNGGQDNGLLWPEPRGAEERLGVAQDDAGSPAGTT
jgi:Protein of unknown function (DUF1360)